MYIYFHFSSQSYWPCGIVAVSCLLRLLDPLPSADAEPFFSSYFACLWLPYNKKKCK